ncbi:MAG: ABC transporter permease [Clostridiales bacterium]|mgnify:CR=1 FL=1|jgi:ribose transport system permease protein|nr:ABC transporter permease [Clostridiales bacterium]
MKKKFNLFTWLLDKRELSLTLLILAMAVILSFTTDTFATRDNIFNIFKQAAITAVLACGLTFIISGGGIDLSVANNMCLASVVLCMVYNATQSDILALLVGVVLAATVGALNGVLVTKLGLPPFIVTLGMSNIASGLALVVTKGYPINFSNKSLMFTVGQKSLFGIPILILLIPFFTLIGQFVLRKTVLGNRLQACGGNPVAASLSGLNVANLKILTYTIGGIFAGFAAFMLAGRINSGNPSAAGTVGMDAICAVVVGGTSMAGGGGTVVGAMVGAILMQLIKNALIQYEVSMYWQTAVIGIVLVCVCALDLVTRKAGEAGQK